MHYYVEHGPGSLLGYIELISNNIIMKRSETLEAGTLIYYLYIIKIN